MTLQHCPRCGWRHWFDHPQPVTCYRCRTTFQLGDAGAAATGEIAAVVHSTTRFRTTTLPPLTNPADAQRAIRRRRLQRQRQRRQGRRAWRALHTMRSPTPAMIDHWLRMVPAINCSCRAFARQYIHDHPPPMDDPDAFFVWSWQFHDSVDRKTGDRRMSLIAARQRWDRPAAA